MDKPTVFFSHSSIDRDYITELQRSINTRTSGTINIFQSSDGESIPFGNNWVHKIEENLHKAKIMFVFISPKSLSSSWIYFESGFAYAKNIKVIPIGIKGVDIGKLLPPLNLLQGFNIASNSGMNNIISILNDEFSCSFPDSFDTGDYNRLVLCDEGEGLRDSGVFDNINCISFEFPKKINVNTAKGESALAFGGLNNIKKKLDGLGVQSVFSGGKELYAHGLIAVDHSEISNYPFGVSVTIDPYMLRTYESIVSNMFDGMYEEGVIKNCWGKIYFEKSVNLETTGFKVSSKLSQVGVELSELNGRFYRFGCFEFSIIPEKDVIKNNDSETDMENLRIIYSLGHFSIEDLVELLKILVRVKIVS